MRAYHVHGFCSCALFLCYACYKRDQEVIINTLHTSLLYQAIIALINSCNSQSPLKPYSPIGSMQITWNSTVMSYNQLLIKSKQVQTTHSCLLPITSYTIVWCINDNLVQINVMLQFFLISHPLTSDYSQGVKNCRFAQNAIAIYNVTFYVYKDFY